VADARGGRNPLMFEEYLSAVRGTSGCDDDQAAPVPDGEHRAGRRIV
jgi:hypothetical protein